MPLLFLIALLCLGAAAPAFADTPADPEFRRWAVGYDFGLSARYYLNEHWGLGARLRPDWRDQNSTAKDRDLYQEDGQSEITRTGFDEGDYEDQGISVAFMVFREARYGRWLSIGPYAEVAYSWSRDQNLTQQTRTDPDPDFADWIDWQGRSSDYRFYIGTLDLGARPVFHLSERFRLESQLGVQLRFERRKNQWISESRRGPPDDVRITRNEDNDTSDSWSAAIIGERLGLGAILAFHVAL